MLTIHNSYTRKDETFEPIHPGNVRMYVCGITVYDYLHVGHARMLIVFDMVARYLRARGYALTYVRNITDIDDKIIKRAHENGESIDALTERFIRCMHEDLAALGACKPDYEPRATQSVPGMIRMIETLIARGHAYAAANGDVYYDVSSFADYGRLSGKRLEDLRAGARVEIGEAKNDPPDFVLWKAAKPGEPSWESPWGRGRPGWHIECSVMSTDLLGTYFDIHGGGMDLQFPHHENEIAQSCGASGDRFVKYWMHNGFVRINDEKMSKSLGNFFTVREVLAKFRPEVLRYFILASHYRSPLDYSDQHLHAAGSALEGYYLALRGLAPSAPATEEEFATRFHQAIEDDFNTPKAFAQLAALVTEINRAKKAGDVSRATRLGATLRQLGEPLGLFQQNPEEYFRWQPRAVDERLGTGGAGSRSANRLSDTDVEKLIERRNAARKAKNFAESDRIRDELKDAGVILEDGPSGTTWRRA